MEDLLKIQQKLIPEVIEIMTKRYLVLREISLSGPIGRRALANNLQNSERIIRTETELLKQQGLIDVASKGMTITQEGQQLLKTRDALRRRDEGSALSRGPARRDRLGQCPQGRCEASHGPEDRRVLRLHAPAPEPRDAV